MKIELYIDRQLVDIGDPSKFSVTLKRQLYNPSELNTKDAQASYSITLPATNTNNHIFTHSNVEEVRGKFERLYDAELIVNGIRIFEGKFKLSEIDTYNYKGNLGIPAPKTTKDIFGDKNMNELGEWRLDLEDKADGSGKESTFDLISRINKESNPDCIFPLALYGLMARNIDAGVLLEKAEQGPNFIDPYQTQYKYIYDENVRFGVEDIPASVNCLRMLETLFNNQGYKLTGSALADERLKHLYVSYRNPNDYLQGWNWGDLGKMKVSARWGTSEMINDIERLERQFVVNTNPDNDSDKSFNLDLFSCNNLKVKEIVDAGSNVIYNEIDEDYSDKNKYNYKRKSLNLIIPKSGYYKVKLDCLNLKLYPHFTILKKVYGELEYQAVTDLKADLTHTGASVSRSYNNNFRRSRYELQVMRDYGKGEFKNVNLVGLFNKPQFNQTKIDDKEQAPKYYPKANGPMVIDPSVNQNFVNGLRWGAHGDASEYNPVDGNLGDKKTLAYPSPNYMFIANGFSWDKKFEQKTKILSAYDSQYYKDGKPEPYNYNKFGVEDTEGEEYDEETGEVIEKKDEEGTTEQKEVKLREGNTRLGNFSGYRGKNYIVNIDDKGQPTNQNSGDNDYLRGKGYVESVIWLERGERLRVCLAGDMGDFRQRDGTKNSYIGDSSYRFIKKNIKDNCIVAFEEIDFTLEVEPYRTDIEWNTFDSKGSYTTGKRYEMKWNLDPVYDEDGKRQHRPYEFRSEHINLIEFLPSNVRANDWIENFCKAFNLTLTNTEGKNFELNVNRTSISSDTARAIDIDQRAHLVHRSNQSLGLPSEYRLSFSTNDDEEGYVFSKEKRQAEADSTKYTEGDSSKGVSKNSTEPIAGETGAGSIKTGSIETTTVDQSSSFSYCWYTQLSVVDKPEDYPKYEKEHIIPWKTVPVISKHEVWQLKGWYDYKDMVKKLYFDSAQRFWYKKDTYTLPVGMKSITESKTEGNKTEDVIQIGQKQVEVAEVQNCYPDENGFQLTYENLPRSITREYFFVPDAGLSYTEVECFLTPDEYNRLNVSLIRFNGSLYHAISVDGYDPSGRKSAKLKLIPKIN